MYRTYAMPVAQQGSDLSLRGIACGLRGGGSHDVLQPVLPGDFLLQRGDGNVDAVILVLSQTGLSLRREHAHNLERQRADAYRLADGISIAEQVLLYC